MRGNNRGFIRLQRKIEGKTVTSCVKDYPLPNILNVEKMHRIIRSVLLRETNEGIRRDTMSAFTWSTTSNTEGWTKFNMRESGVTPSMLEECESWAEQLGIHV